MFLERKESFDTKSKRDQNLRITNMEPSEEGTLYGIPQKEFSISQKEVHCIFYVLLVNRIPKKELTSLRRRYTLSMYNL